MHLGKGLGAGFWAHEQASRTRSRRHAPLDRPFRETDSVPSHSGQAPLRAEAVALQPDSEHAGPLRIGYHRVIISRSSGVAADPDRVVKPFPTARLTADPYATTGHFMNLPMAFQSAGLLQYALCE